MWFTLLISEILTFISAMLRHLLRWVETLHQRDGKGLGPYKKNMCDASAFKLQRIEFGVRSSFI